MCILKTSIFLFFEGGKLMRTAIYIRVSTEDQAKEGYSISAQKEKLTAYCMSQGWEIVNFYVDEGYSAKNMERPELQRMIQHIKEGVIECVLVYRLDRLTRSVLDLYKLLELFEKYNCKFKSATEVYDTTTAIGRMFITVVAALAQWERENLGERVRMGMQEKARQGKWVPNQAPYGYDIDLKNDKLKINTFEASVVRRIFDMYLSGMGTSKIAAALNQEGIKTKNNAIWRSFSIRYILRNPLYAGKIRWNVRINSDQYFEVPTEAVPPIISEEIFIKTQKMLDLRRERHPRTATSEYIFSGVARCARCGSPLFGKRNARGVKFYGCLNRRVGMCDMPSFKEEYLEERFLEYLNKIDIRKAVAKVVNDNSGKQEQDIDKIQKELSAIEKRRKKWQYAWANDIISDDEFTERMNEERKKEELLKEQLKNLSPIQTNDNIVDILSILSNIKATWKNMNTSEKKSYIGFIMKKIVVDKVEQKKNAECVEIVDIEFY
jgi:site-specific DNA recombinase